MPRIEVEGYGVFEARPNTRLVKVLEEHGVDILHRCGGFARCTTCRVEFKGGEPDSMTVAEQKRLVEKGLDKFFRLSCQILCDHDMKVCPMMTLHESGLTAPGPEPADTITPEPEWTIKI